MTHDTTCEGGAVYVNVLPDGQRMASLPCGCADRAIAKARREGRIEGFTLGWNRGMDWSCANPHDLADIARGQVEVAVDDEWPEDKGDAT